MTDTKYSLSELAASRRLAELPDQAADLQRHIKIVEARAEAAEAAAIEAKAALAKAVLGAAQAEAVANEAQAQAKAELERENRDLRDALLKAQMMVSALENRLEALYQHPDRIAEDLRHHDGEDDAEIIEEESGSQAAVPPVIARVADPRMPLSTLSVGTAGPRVAAAPPRRRALAPGRIALGVPAAILCVAVVMFPSAGLMDFDVRDASMTVDGGKVAMRGGAPIERRISQNESVSRPADVALIKDQAAIKSEAQQLELARETAVRAVVPRRDPLRKLTNKATVVISADRTPSGSWLLWMPIEREAIERAMKSAPPSSSANPPYPPNAPGMSQAALLAP